MRRAVALAAGLVGWSFASPRIPPPWRSPSQAAVGAALIWATRPALGLTPPRLWAGLRLGLAAAAAAEGAVGSGVALPAVRLAMATREMPASGAGWLALDIPLGTVWAEEAAFRGALAAVAAEGCSAPAAQLLQAAAFGLSHIVDARGTGSPIVATVLVTGAAGWLFGWLAERSGSLAAPLLAHLAINEAGAVAVLALQARHRRLGR